MTSLFSLNYGKDCWYVQERVHWNSVVYTQCLLQIHAMHVDDCYVTTYREMMNRNIYTNFLQSYLPITSLKMAYWTSRFHLKQDIFFSFSSGSVLSYKMWNNVLEFTLNSLTFAQHYKCFHYWFFFFFPPAKLYYKSSFSFQIHDTICLLDKSLSVNIKITMKFFNVSKWYLVSATHNVWWLVFLTPAQLGPGSNPMDVSVPLWCPCYG